MRRHEIDHILTFNVGDFRRYDHVEVLEPDQVLATAGDAENPATD